MSERRILWGKLTPLSLAALALALAGGAYGTVTGSPAVRGFADFLAPVGDAWLVALQIVIIPLVVTQMLLAVLGATDRRAVGLLGARTLGVIVPVLVSIGVVTLIVMGPVARMIDVDPATVEAIRADTVVPDAVLGGGGDGSAGWLQRLNVFAAAAAGRILPLILATLVVGLVLSTLRSGPRERVVAATDAVSRVTLRVVGWILWLTPVAVLVLVLGLSLEIGLETVGLLWFYVVIVSAWILLMTGALYPVAAVFARVPVRRFARAVAPAQAVAFGTRSSLMSLPALVEGAREHLRMGEAGTGFVLPLCVSIFKPSSPATAPVRYLFLAHLFGEPVTLASAATFLAIIVLLSFSIVGIPGGGSGFDTLPAFMAVGIPIEGLVLVVAVDTIPDIAKTLINVTGHMSVASIVTRSLDAGD